MAVPQLRIAALSPDALKVVDGPPSYGDSAWQTGGGSICKYAPDGSLCVLCNQQNITFYRTTDMSVSATCTAEAPVQLVDISPTGQYLTTLEKSLPSLGQNFKNLKVWKTTTGELVASFSKRNVNDDVWPAIQFNPAETHLFFTAKDSVVGYELSGDFSKADVKVKMDGATQFAMCPKKSLLATFTPEGKARPAVCAVIDWSDGGSIVNRKQFFRAQRAKLVWNVSGTHVLCQSICDFDATNQSYFGESRLYLLSANGQLDMAVTMENEAVIQDVAWCPDGKHFAAIGGISPATAVLFDQKGKAVYKLGKGPYNQVQWSPHGRFVMLAGFGNLPGDIQLFDKKADHACKPMGGCRSECSVLAQWSPCGRYFLTACTAPRMRVDNRITVFTYYGEKVDNTDYKELLHAQWQPTPIDAYPDRPQSPDRLKDVAENRKQGVNLTVAAKAKGYVPPHMRGKGGERQQARVEGFDGDLGSGKMNNSAGPGRTVPGAEGGKSASKNAKKRANKAAKKAAEEDTAAVDQVTSGVANMQTSTNGGTATGPEQDAAATDPAKRLRNLRKKLQKVDAAKEKRARGDQLTPEQQTAVDGEDALREEMRSLGATDV